jgi:hypothetical protein
LRHLYWVLLFGFFLSFNEWFGGQQVTVQAAQAGLHICLPYFQDCGRFYFLRGWPDSYGQSIFYAALSGTLALSALAAWRHRWDLAHALMLPAFAWKLIFLLVLTYQSHVDFEYFHLPEVAVFLFARQREYFVRRVFVTVYLMAATMKFDESWIVGNYFSSLTAGLPLFPRWSIPLVTNAVALFEIVSPWFLLSGRRRARLTAVGLWSVFHLYSIILVGYRYPAHCLPMLWVLFLPDPRPEDSAPRFRAADAVGWALIALLFLLTAVPQLHPVDRLYTLYGKKFGVGMLVANYQCLSTERVHFDDGREERGHSASRAAMHRCEPYRPWFRLRQKCMRPDVRTIEWRFAVSVNGGPFYTVVDTADACALTYHAWGDNAWIKGPSRGAPIAGYPGPNAVSKAQPGGERSPLMSSAPRIELSPLQSVLREHLPVLRILDWILWFSAGAFFIGRRLRLTFGRCQRSSRR